MLAIEPKIASLEARRDRPSLADHFDALASSRQKWIARSWYYHQELARMFSFFIPPDRSVLEIGCGIGYLLDSLKPKRGVGLDISPEMVRHAQNEHPHLEFRVDDLEDLQTGETFDYVVISDLVGFLHDVQHSFENLHRVCTPRTRILISYYNFLWEPVLWLLEKLRLKASQPVQNWLAPSDIQNLLELAGFEVVRRNSRVLLPAYVPLLSTFCNRVLANLPGFRQLALVDLLVARPKPQSASGILPEEERSCRPDTAGAFTCSVVIPCRNERGNIEEAVLRTPQLGSHTEIVFVEGNSNDGTEEEIKRVIAAYPDHDIKLIPQGDGRGKGDAVRKGFAAATGDVLMILDADLTVDPEELPKFFDALIRGQGEFIHGSRLVYPMEKQAMRFLNILGNKFFSLAFTYLLGQRFKDTLCGTKVLFRSDYEQVAANRHYFGDFDPFGDFDLIFGAAKLNLKIVEIPIHYRERTYGTTNISRFKHGWLLLRMSCHAMMKMKFV